VLLCNSDFHHNLLLKGHANLLNSSHALGNHTQILVEVLVSFLLIIFSSVIFEVLGKFEDLLFGGIKGEDKDLLNVFQRGIK
jgi:hypothetical protein